MCFNHHEKMKIDFMKAALKEASESGADLPVGAVIVHEGKIIASAHNKKEANNDVTAHAEIEAIRQASKKLNNWRLSGCDLYVTLEPCPMCAWAIFQARLKTVYFGAYDSLYGAFTTLHEMKKLSSSQTEVKGGIMEEECTKIIKEYFERLR